VLTPKKKSASGKRKKRIGTKAKPSKPAKARSIPRRVETRRPEAPGPVQSLVRVEPPAQESVRITLANIRGETAIGDLLVAFPRTREILAKNGLRLDAEDAGDIYMTIDAFSALNGLKTEALVQDLIDVAKEPPPQQVVSSLIVSTAT
jgi:hypothetical protein